MGGEGTHNRLSPKHQESRPGLSPEGRETGPGRPAPLTGSPPSRPATSTPTCKRTNMLVLPMENFLSDIIRFNGRTNLKLKLYISITGMEIAKACPLP